ncbi:MAG: hypothetical protein WC518_02670 [Patescibacteria group bacterium]
MQISIFIKIFDCDIITITAKLNLAGLHGRQPAEQGNLFFRMALSKDRARARKLSQGHFSHPVFIVGGLMTPNTVQPRENSMGGVLEDNIHNY